MKAEERDILLGKLAALIVDKTGLLATPEHRFHPGRQWRLDLAWPSLKVGLEVQGLLFQGKGKHVAGIRVLGDLEKANQAGLDGWLVIYCSTKQLQEKATVQRILDAMEAQRQALVDLGPDDAVTLAADPGANGRAGELADKTF